MSEDPAVQAAQSNHLADFGKVAGELVHDLANDMQVLQGWAALAKGEVDRGAMPREEVERVNRMAEGLGRMLQDVLATVAGQRVSPEVTFDPRTLTELVVSDRMTELSLGDIRLRERVPGGVQVVGRASFWTRIVVNLLRNAARHARSRVLVILDLDCDERGREEVVLRVEDDGQGVPEEHRGSVFQPLFRGSNGGAAGLGLSSVVWSVEQLGGRVRYATDSELGGAAFEVRVPTARGVVVREPRDGGAAALAGLRIFLIEDDESVCGAVCRLLSRSDVTVRAMDPGGCSDDEILKQILGFLPDGILMDLHLHDRGGVDLWKRLQQGHPEYAERVVFISGSAPGDPEWDAAQATGCPVLAKPFDFDTLRGHVAAFRAQT
jgi:CheY-like chemotaxis protein